MKKIIALIGIALLIIFLVVLGVLAGREKDISDAPSPQKKVTLVILPIVARGDFIDPGPIEEECRRRMEQEFDSSGFSECNLSESRVGFSEEECPNGFSPQGCSICKLECR